MCGIVGYAISKTHSHGPYSGNLQTAIASLNHRGPDHSAVWFSPKKNIGFAHSRLSILDLSDLANQPMIDPSKKYIISFNGEIYNFKELRSELESLGSIFRSKSDTEVILNGFIEWGPNIFQKLQGMFAISILDLVSSSIFLARDHSGQKPLYFNFDERKEAFIFGSEIKAINKFSIFKNQIDQFGLNQLFSEGYCSGKQSIFADTFKVNAGSYIKFDYKNQKLGEHIYWDLAEIVNRNNTHSIKNHDLDFLTNKLSNLLEQSIELQLNADVPVGLLLSGGVDSSLIVAIASKIRDNLNTFTVRFSEHNEFDEAEHAQVIASKFHTNHIELDASIIEPSIFDELTRYYDEPIFDTSMVPTFLLSKLVSNHCKVALGGDGGDELFGGYPHYDKLLKINDSSRYIPEFLRTGASAVLQNTLPIGVRGKKTAEFFASNLEKSYPNTAELFSYKERGRLFNAKYIELIDVEPSRREKLLDTPDLIERFTYHDFNNFLREDILVKVDRASMANSLEIRAPFLDHKIIEFAFTEIPSDFKVTTQERKIILKNLAQRILPDRFDLVRKQGFSLPLKKLVIQEDWHDFFRDKIHNSNPDVFNKAYAMKLLKSQHDLSNNAERLSALVFFMSWVERFNPSFS
jgi:asparagine synthase (glutamine-hydrolysing)